MGESITKLIRPTTPAPLTPPDLPTADDLQIPRFDEETLVADGRAGLTPSEQVEERLIGLLRASPVTISHMQRRLRPGPR